MSSRRDPALRSMWDANRGRYPCGLGPGRRDARELARFVRRYGPRFVVDRLRNGRLPLEPAPHRPAPERWPADRLTVAWLGHATVLINLYGTWLLTDPALRRRVGIGLGRATVGPRRLVQPPLAIGDLPALDGLLISHAHMDHCDLGTLRRLPRELHVVVPPGNGDLVRGFVRVDELGWHERTTVAGARIEAVPVRHWGARTFTDRHRGYGGFLIQKNGHTVLFAGDTAYTPQFRELARRARIDLAIMPIGGYNPFIYAHADPEQAWAMAREMGAAAVLPIHHSTFTLSREPRGEPIARLRAAAGAQAHRIVAAEIGQTWTL